MKSRHRTDTLSMSSAGLLMLLIVACAALAQDTVDEPGDMPPPTRGEPRMGHDGPLRPRQIPGDMMGRRDRRRPGDHEPWRELTDEQIQERLAIIREVNPEMAKRIEHAMTSGGGRHSDRLRQALHRHWPKIEEMRNLKRHDSELYELIVADKKLERQCRQLAMKIRRGNGENSEAKDDLRGLIVKHFDVRQHKFKHTLAKLEKRVLELKKNLDMRLLKRTELEAQQFAELVGASDAVKF